MPEFHWTAWLAVPLAAAAGGAVAGAEGKKLSSAIGAAGGTIAALSIFAVIAIRPRIRVDSPGKISPERLKKLLR